MKMGVNEIDNASQVKEILKTAKVLYQLIFYQIRYLLSNKFFEISSASLSLHFVQNLVVAYFWADFHEACVPGRKSLANLLRALI